MQAFENSSSGSEFTFTHEKSESQLSDVNLEESTLQETLLPEASTVVIEDSEAVGKRQDLDLNVEASIEKTDKEAETPCDSLEFPTTMQLTSPTSEILFASQPSTSASSIISEQILPETSFHSKPLALSGEPSIAQNPPSIVTVSPAFSLHSTPPLLASVSLPLSVQTDLSQVISSLTPVTVTNQPSQSLAIPPGSSVTQIQSQANANYSSTISPSFGSEVKTAKKHRLENPLVSLFFPTQFF
jgi:hypothetical protein